MQWHAARRTRLLREISDALASATAALDELRRDAID
jgi:hypothetical protein